MDPAPASVDPELVEAFRATEYLVQAETPFVLRVDQSSAALDALLDAVGRDCAAFVTAWNPFSVVTDEATNRAAQARLEAELRAAGHAPVPGCGRDPLGHWPGEPSLLVPGLGRDAALDLGHRYGQHAVLWVRRGAPVELAWTGACGAESR